MPAVVLIGCGVRVTGAQHPPTEMRVPVDGDTDSLGEAQGQRDGVHRPGCTAIIDQDEIVRPAGQVEIRSAPAQSVPRPAGRQVPNPEPT